MTLLARAAVLLIALNALTVGVWAQFAPESFYRAFPGLGWAWVSVDGPYNEHLIRDVGGLNLALGVLGLLALWQPGLAAPFALASLAYQLPHNAYHLAHLELIASPLERFAQSAGLLFNVLAALIVVFWCRPFNKGVSRG